MSTTPPDDPAQPGTGGYPAYPGEGGGQPTGPGGYPTHPGMPPGGGHPGQPGAPGAEVPQPGSIRLAVRLMWAGAVVSLLSLIVGIATLGGAKEEIRDELAKDDPTVSQSTVDAAYAIGVVFVVVIGVLSVLLWLWMAWKNGQGRQWARVVATVLAGLNVLFTLLSLVVPRTTADENSAALAFSLVNLVLAIVILVLLWRKDSNDFFAARSRPQWG
ncbi:hypothetical protein [Aeromicrobium sp. NPDC092404]|uniref:hypothetical protein n=1 Tax=Aeromicrobium sp. NPDC092404 TaxID=3154976 RepID=UPI00342F89A2